MATILHPPEPEAPRRFAPRAAAASGGPRSYNGDRSYLRHDRRSGDGCRAIRIQGVTYYFCAVSCLESLKPIPNERFAPKSQA